MGASDSYRQAAVSLADEMAARGIDLVYGGSDIGLMGVVARRMLEKGRHVTGIIPKMLHDHVKSLDVSDLIIVGTMHERKAAMYERSDAFLALPGGIGTLEELLEVYTWAQLGYHTKPASVLNIEGYYNHLIKQLEHSTQEGFMQSSHLDGLLISSVPKRLIDMIESYEHAYRPKWEE
jgi:hypothetical protein